ncbi:MAG: DUF1549 and DUF1553 domain-containing protein [Planctomycetia bacterium]|nr:DUF1549 and DUF1553 domain-containing protein [Planctomycetia bacterium]
MKLNITLTTNVLISAVTLFASYLLRPITVAAVESPTATAPNFVRDVVPVLTKAGCNAGACHGAFSGRGGFRLSLLGFDPDADFDAIVHDTRGRRISATAPENSLLLRKAGGLMPHGGGLRMTSGSESHTIVRSWLDHGAPGPDATRLHVTTLKVTPADVVLQLTRNDSEGDRSQTLDNEKHTLVRRVNVEAIWSDGITQDVTRWALFDSGDNNVAEGANDGLIAGKGPGRTSMTVRFMGQVASVSVTVPFAMITDYPAFVTSNFIDEHVLTEWKKVGLIPEMLADDATFLRRVSLDVIGTLPAPNEVREFLASSDPQKRAKAVDTLLGRREYVDCWTLKWSELLRVHRRSLGEKGLDSFQSWLRAKLRDNQSAQILVKELITAKGNLYTNGPVGFYFVDQTPVDLAETTAQIFLGIRMQCAKCHHHPFEVWSQEDYYGLAAFFSGVQRKDTKEGGRFGGSQSIFVANSHKITNPMTSQVIAARVLGAAAPVAEADDCRPELADWMTSKENPYFAKNLVNRYWGYLFGRGLVEPIDDLRATNPASHPELLNALATDFVAHGYDFKHLLRTICNSRVYQLATNLNPERDRNGMFFSFHLPRRLPAEVLLDAINQATGSTEGFPNLPVGTRAIELPDSTIASYFLETFGRPKRTGTCECERVTTADLNQSLHLANGEAIHQKVTAKDGRLSKLLAAQTSNADLISELYLATLSRLPTEQELAAATKHVTAATNRPEAYEDLLWTLLNFSEFSYQH